MATTGIGFERHGKRPDSEPPGPSIQADTRDPCTNVPSGDIDLADGQVGIRQAQVAGELQRERGGGEALGREESGLGRRKRHSTDPLPSMAAAIVFGQRATENTSTGSARPFSGKRPSSTAFEFSR